MIGLKFLQQGITNFKALQAQGFRGWDFSTSPCQGWMGVTCDASGRVAKLCAASPPPSAACALCMGRLLLVCS